MDKLQILIAYNNMNSKTELEELNLELLEGYKFELKKVGEERLDYSKYDFVLMDSYEEEIVNEIKHKIILAIDFLRGERPSDYIKLGIENFLLKPYSLKEIRLKLNKIKNESIKMAEAEDNKLKFYTLLDNIPYMAWFKNIESQYMVVNKEFKEHCGKDYELIRGKGDNFVWDGMIGEKCRLFDIQVMEERKQIVFDETIPGRKGYKEFNIYKVPVIDSNNYVKGTMGIAKDITDLKNKDVKFDTLLENIPFGVFIKSLTGEIKNANREFLRMTKFQECDLGFIKEEDFLGTFYKKQIEIEDKQITKKREKINLIRVLDEYNDKKIIEFHKVPFVDISGEVSGIMCIMRDITEMKNQEEQIKRLAYTDSLTGLSNRRGMYSYIEEVLKEEESDITIMFIDLDNFKQLNDVFGHLYGDGVLMEFSKCLKKICPDGFVSRIGGDEFIILWPKKLDKDIMIEIGDSIIDIFTNKNHKNKFNRISASIGIVSGNIGEESIDSFLLKGDLALYKAKDQGKNQYVFYNKALEKKRCLNEEIENDLRMALEKNELMLHYQPQYSTSRELIGFEALLRWDNDKYRSVPIIDIINIMEKSTLVDEIGNFVLESAFKFSKNINEKLENKVVVSVNISAIQIVKNSFVRNIKKIIKRVEVNPRYIGLEITESVLLQNMDESIGKIKELKDIGVEIALDDFGTGYSSLSYLVKLPLSILKIDKSFIWGMKESREYKTLVKLCVDTAHALNLKVIAEGVETECELKALKKMNVDYIQGYLFSKPVPEDIILEQFQ